MFMVSPALRCLCRSLLLKGSTPLSPAAARDPSHRKQPSMNFSNTSPSHRLQFFMNCFSVGASHGVTSPASKPAAAWAALSMGPQVLPGTCFSTSSPWGHSLLWASTCSSMGSSMDCRWIYMLHHGPPWAAGEQPASLWSAPWASGEPLVWHKEHLLPLLLH